MWMKQALSNREPRILLFQGDVNPSGGAARLCRLIGPADVGLVSGNETLQFTGTYRKGAKSVSFHILIKIRYILGWGGVR